MISQRIMGMSVTHLGTGSRGNATLIDTEKKKILIDQGFSGKEIEKRLARMEIKPNEIDAMVISHHHGDHGGGAKIMQKKWNTPIYCNFRTAGALGLDLVQSNIFDDFDLLEFDESLSVLPIPVPHSGADNVCFVASHQKKRAAIITDLGSWTEEMVTHIKGCDHISVEANYDVNRLWNGPYPQTLKNRISGKGGHLSNDQTGEFLTRVVDKETRSIVLTHLSEKNNLPHLAESTVLYHLDELFQGDIAISMQDGPDFSHHIGQYEKETNPDRGLVLRG